jgi:hypothetical protein
LFKRPPLRRDPAVGWLAQSEVSTVSGKTVRFKSFRQLRLRTLLIVIGALCAGGGYYADRYHRQRQVTELVTRHGGQIAYRKALRSDEPAREPRPLSWLEGFALRDIEAVTLFFASIEDSDLAVLRNCPRLKRLDLDYTTISDRGLAEIAHLSSLVRLDVKQTNVTDAGMEAIAQLPQLESLLLDGVSLTDSGLKHLESLPSLRYLSLRQTEVSQAGLERFQRVKPECIVAR